MASRRLLLPSALRAAAATAPHRAAAARPLFAPAARVQIMRPAAVRGETRIARRWFSRQGDEAERKVWEFEEIQTLVARPEAERKVVIVDVREPVELFETGKIPGAINIPITSAIQSFHMPPDEFEDVYGFPQPAKDAELLFYCKAGVRARAAAGLAKSAGWENVGEYPGSWLDWAGKEGPVEVVKGEAGERAKRGVRYE